MASNKPEIDCKQDCALFPFVDAGLTNLANSNATLTSREALLATHARMIERSEDCSGDVHTCPLASYVIFLTSHTEVDPHYSEEA